MVLVLWLGNVLKSRLKLSICLMTAMSLWVILLLSVKCCINFGITWTDHTFYFMKISKEILDDFMGLSEVWKNFQCINVYWVSCCWRLLRRNRDENYCCTMVDGWQKMRDGLGFEIGDICIFHCPIDSCDQFRIPVLKFDAWIDFCVSFVGCLLHCLSWIFIFSKLYILKCWDVYNFMFLSLVLHF